VNMQKSNEQPESQALLASLGNCCGSCRHWHWKERNPGKTWAKLVGDSYGQCRRHARQPDIEPEEGWAAHVCGTKTSWRIVYDWPYSIFTDICDEHKRKQRVAR